MKRKQNADRLKKLVEAMKRIPKEESVPAQKIEEVVVEVEEPKEEAPVETVMEEAVEAEVPKEEEKKKSRRGRKKKEEVTEE